MKNLLIRDIDEDLFLKFKGRVIEKGHTLKHAIELYMADVGGSAGSNIVKLEKQYGKDLVKEK